MAITFNRDLVNDIARRRVVVFVGSGVSASAKTRGGDRIRDWEGFLHHAANFVQASEDKDLIESTLLNRDYLMACEIIKDALDKSTWSDLIYEEFSQVGMPSDLHKSLACLDQRITLTTNFDKLLENTFSDTSSSTHYPTTVVSLSDDVFQVLKDDKEYIVKIHGSVDTPDSMIFDKTDYAKKAFSNWAYSEFIEALLISHTFLFVGFSMADPAISLLIERYAQKYPNARPHYIFQSGPIDKRIVEISKKLRKLYIMEYDAADGHAELPKLVLRLSDEAKARRREILAQDLSRL